MGCSKLVCPVKFGSVRRGKDERRCTGGGRHQKIQNRNRAVQCITKISEGELFGIIGADGAGKTTLFRILCTLMLADEGRAEVLGLDSLKDYRGIRSRIGYMPGRFSLYTDLSVEENLKFFGHCVQYDG